MNADDDERNPDQVPFLDHRGVLSVNGVGGTAALNAAIRVCLQGVLQTVKPTSHARLLSLVFRTVRFVHSVTLVPEIG